MKRRRIDRGKKFEEGSIKCFVSNFDYDSANHGELLLMEYVQTVHPWHCMLVVIHGLAWLVTHSATLALQASRHSLLGLAWLVAADPYQEGADIEEAENAELRGWKAFMEEMRAREDSDEESHEEEAHEMEQAEDELQEPPAKRP
eukprot:1134212-Amphidinium_carterae.1